MRTTGRWTGRLLVACACALAAAVSRGSSPLDLNSLHGRVVYLDFWASWCTPCRQSFPWMQAMKDAYERQGLSVVAINLDQERDDAERFLQKFHPSFDVRFDPRGTLAEQFKVSGMPSSVVIDRHGIVRFTHIGFRPADGDTYENQLRELIAEK
jgi:cytochrome c biogenesis protein CcmG, thiol:disulfide interchange protein DsbE